MLNSVRNRLKWENPIRCFEAYAYGKFQLTNQKIIYSNYLVLDLDALEDERLFVLLERVFLAFET